MDLDLGTKIFSSAVGSISMARIPTSVLVLLQCSLLVAFVEAYRPSVPIKAAAVKRPTPSSDVVVAATTVMSRRHAAQGMLSVFLAASFGATIAPTMAVADGGTTGSSTGSNTGNVLRSKGCYQGQGEACADLADNNALITSLQQKSAANRDKNERDARNAYYVKNYPDFFASLNKVMIQQADGSFVVLSEADADLMKRSGQLYYDVKKTKSGGIDYTQRPVLTFKDGVVVAGAGAATPAP